MKTKLLLLALALNVSARADFESWTNSDGRSAELELVKVTGSGADKAGEFKMRNGRTVTLKASELSADDAKRLDEWKPAAAGAPAAAPAFASVYDDVLDGNLLTLSGRSLKRTKDFAKPSKYYLFYHTASWCGPCQAFTPSLVEFYDKNKPGNNEFEIILITSDSSEDAMEGYALNKKMTWPHLKLAKVEKFNKKFEHPGTGIPNLVLTDLQGNIIKCSYDGDTYLGPAVVMNHLDGLLNP